MLCTYFDNKEADESFTQAINLKPNFPEAHLGRADARILREDYSGAIEDYERAIAIYQARGQSQFADMLSAPLNAVRNQMLDEQEDDIPEEQEGK